MATVHRIHARSSYHVGELWMPLNPNVCEPMFRIPGQGQQSHGIGRQPAERQPGSTHGYPLPYYIYDTRKPLSNLCAPLPHTPQQKDLLRHRRKMHAYQRVSFITNPHHILKLPYYVQVLYQEAKTYTENQQKIFDPLHLNTSKIYLSSHPK